VDILVSKGATSSHFQDNRGPFCYSTDHIWLFNVSQKLYLCMHHFQNVGIYYWKQTNQMLGIHN